jgi:uncharacterized membrane protein YeaQ/YmgE (transglycosylase-associated protein family)
MKISFMSQLFLFSFDGFVSGNKSLLITLFIGAVAGLLASYFTPGRGFGLLISVVLGIVGGWLGNMLFGSFLHLTSNPLINQIICATAGAMILVVVINLFASKKEQTDRSAWRA